METILDLHDLHLPLRGAEVRRAQDGFVLAGEHVAGLHPFGLTRFYRHGWQSWSQCGWLDLRHPPAPIEPPQRRAQGDDPLYATWPLHSGSGVGALRGPDGRVLLLGALAPGARVAADQDTLRGFYEQGGGEWFLAWGPEDAVFARYAEELAARLGRRGEQPAPRVWCSWYGLYTSVSEDILNATLAGLAGLPFDVVQIDDGWQQDVGDWEPNAKFPGGMDAPAGRIRRAGYTPGLWLAPLLVRPTARLFRERPAWLLRDEHGVPVPAGYNWNTPTYALDSANPEVLDWLEALLRRAIGWGYTYLKLDFLYAGALPGARRDGVPREAAYRAALARVRAAIGDAYLLVCGAPVLPSLGLADGLRIGPDVAPYWDNPERRLLLHDPTGPSALNALRTSLARLWLRPLVHTDPDVVYFRERYNLLMPHERAALQALAHIAGFKATSDLPHWLDPHERDALRAFLEARPEVTRLGYATFTVGGQPVDFAPLLGEESHT
jgi:alpha-galactosidase